ncbi:MAG: hypothetical protein FWB78_12995 [Treponema sp.]|nr:hypothetical protein [Treponema sp.]
MIEIPLGKALTSVEKGRLGCEDCFFCNAYRCFEKMACRSSYRADGKDVIFKLIDINQNTGGDDGTDWPGNFDGGNRGNRSRDSEKPKGKTGFSGKQEGQMRETAEVRKQIAGVMARTRGRAIGLAVAVFASGWVLAAVFAGLWIYERWIG